MEKKIILYTKDKKPGNPLALADLLDKDTNELFIRDLMLSAKLGKNIGRIPEQFDAKPDLIDTDSKQEYEVKTVWEKSGCKIMAQSKKDVTLTNRIIEELGVVNSAFNFDTMKFNPSCITDESKYTPAISALIEKMKKKQNCNWVLFYPFTIDEGGPANSSALQQAQATVDSAMWHYILKKYSFDFTLYMIKPTFEKVFICDIIEREIPHGRCFPFRHDIYFNKYIGIE